MEVGIWEMAGEYLDNMQMGSQDAAGASSCIWEFRNTAGLPVTNIIKEISSWDYLLHSLILDIFPELLTTS